MPSPEDTAIASHSIFIGIIGSILNIGLILITLRNRELRHKHYIKFILNRSIIDLCYTLSLAIFQPLGIFDTAPHLCHIAGFQDVFLACASVVAEPVLACNRFISIYHRSLYDHVYKTNRIYVMCIGIWVLGFCSAVPHVFYSSLGRVPGVLCAVRFEKGTLLITVLSNYTLVCTSLTLVGVFNFKIFQFIRTHQKRRLTGTQKTALQKDTEMAMFILVSALVPLILQTPATVAFFIKMYDKDSITDWIMFLVTAIFSLCPAANPIITAMMIRPIRREFLDWVEGKSARKTAVVPFTYQHSQMPI